MRKRTLLWVSILGAILFNLNVASAIDVKQEEGEILVENKYYKPAPIEKRDIFETCYFILPLQNISTPSSALQFAQNITKGRKTESRIVLTKKEKKKSNLPKVLLVGFPLAGGNLNEYRLYNVETSLKSLSFLQLDIAKCLYTESPRYESHFLRSFPVSLSGLSEYKVVILIDIPSWAFTKRDQNNLLSYVEKGGNLIMVGDHARGYKGTKLAEIFPLEFDYTKEVKGHFGRILKDKSSWLKPAIVDKNNHIIRGLPLDIPEIVVHKSKLKDGNIILTAGTYPLLAERDYGKGRILSFPISLTDRVIPASGRPDGDVKYNFRDDKLINWSFYNELWRNIVLYCIGETPSVDFSHITPPEELITYPASIELSTEITNFSTIPQKGSLLFTLYKDKKEIKKENIKYNLSPQGKKDIVFKIEANCPRGNYSYKLKIKNKEGDILSYFDGTFSTIPKTFLQVELPNIPVFGKNSSVEMTIQSFNLNKENKYYIKTSLFDFRGKRIKELSPIEVNRPKQFYQMSKEMKQVLPIGNLMKGDYQITIELLEDRKGVDIVKKDIYIVPSLDEEDLYPNIIGASISTGDKGNSLENLKKAKEMGFNCISGPGWGRYRKRPRDYNNARVSFYTTQEAQRLGMTFYSCPSYGQNSWNRWWRGCPNTIITEDIERKDIEDIEDYLSLYEKSPRYVATYVADEPGVNFHKWQKCPVCRKAFKDKYDYEMATDIKDRNYYTSYKFMVDSQAECLKKGTAFAKKYVPEFKSFAALCPSTLLGGVNTVEVASSLDFPTANNYSYGQIPYTLDLLWGASNFKSSIWMMTSASIFWGGTYFPEYVGNQIYASLGHNAKGLAWWCWQAAQYDILEDTKRIEYLKTGSNELKQIGPLFKYLAKKRANVAMLYPWTASVLSPKVKAYSFRSFLINVHSVCRQAFGQIDIIHEEQIRKNMFLPDYNTLILPSVAYIPEDVMKKIKGWVKAGGLLIVLPETALYNEYQEKSNTLSEIFSTSYGKEVSLPVKGVGVLPVSGYVLNPVGSQVLYSYSSGEAAITEKGYGKGKVICFGFIPKNKEVLEKITKGTDTWFIKSKNKNIDVNLFSDTPAHYIVAVNQIKKDEKTDISVKLPKREYYIYNLLTGEEITCSYQDNNLVIPLELEPLWGKVLAVLPEKPAKLTLTMSKEAYSRGEELFYKIELLNGKGEVLKCKLPVEVKITDSEGRTREEYAGIRVLNEGVFAKRIILADNEPEGRWKIEVRERISGKEIKKAFRVK